MDDRPYYYRVRGRTIGPVGLRQIRQLAQRAQIGRTTDVSRDGMQWGKAGDWPEIFETGGFEPQAEMLPATTGGGFGGQALSFPTGPAAAPSRWYYSVNGASQGPVDLGVLQQMVAQGQLSANDYVCPEGASDWLTVGSVPQLAGGGGMGMGMGVGMPPVVNLAVSQQQTHHHSGTNGLAIAGFVLSLVSLLLGCLCGLFSIPVSILAIIFSAVAMAGRNQSQKGLAIAGLIIGLVAVVVAVVMVFIGLALLPDVNF